MKLREIGEDRLLGQLLSRLSLGKEVVNGPGDDCAVVETRDHRKPSCTQDRLRCRRRAFPCRRRTRSTSAGKR